MSNEPQQQQIFGGHIGMRNVKKKKKGHGRHVCRFEKLNLNTALTSLLSDSVSPGTRRRGGGSSRCRRTRERVRVCGNPVRSEQWTIVKKKIEKGRGAPCSMVTLFCVIECLLLT